ncbi:MAG: hypothetical protein FJ280_28615 [Planctomycetes bacterium]|nr:hypothetical protein [Planctomycetota bacterium]
MAVKSGAGTCPSSSERRVRGRRRRWFPYAALTVLLAGGIFYAGLRCHWRWDLRRRVGAVRAAGCPVTLAELDAWYPRPESSENAALWIVEATAVYREPADESDGWDLWFLVRDPPTGRTEPLDGRFRALLTRHIAANAQPLKLLHEAAGMEESRYPIDLTQDVGGGASHHGAVVRACALLSVEAVHHVESANPADGVRSIRAALAVADSLRAEPCQLSQANRVLAQSLALSALERALNRAVLTDAQLASLSQAVTKAHRPEAWRRALAGLQCTLLAYREHPERLGLERPSSLIVDAYGTLGLLERGSVVFLKLMDESLALRQLPAHRRMAVARVLEEKWGDALRTFFRVGGPTSVIRQAIEQELTETAQLAVAHTALAVERYRLAWGRLPGSLEDLVPDYLQETPRDPFDGSPLRYRRLKPGFVVYSVGPDETDHGGKERASAKERKAGETHDLVFRVERSESTTR